jgi:hypothetical protein
MSEKKPHKAKLFQLVVMNQLVEVTPFLDTQYEKLKDGAQEKLGYHWNEVVQNVLFNRYVKPNPKLLATYRVLLQQHRREKARNEVLGKGNHGKAKKVVDAQKVAAGTVAAPPAPEPTPIVDRRGHVDTRLTAESDTASVGGSYETPFFLASNKRAAHHNALTMASMVGATLLESAPMASQQSEATTSPLTGTSQLNAFVLLLEAALDQPQSQARLDEIKRANEASAKEQFKQTADQNLHFTEKLADGSATVAVTSELPPVDPTRRPDSDEEKHIRLNRGLNALDQTLIGQPKLPKTLLDRYREQAGAAFKGSEEKVAQYRKDQPEALPPARTQIVKESWLIGRDTQGELHRFGLSELRHVDQVPAGAERLELRALANGHGVLREAHEFYVNLPSKEFMCVPLAQAPLPAPARIDRKLFEFLQHHTYYQSTL